jgi:hypothetical protein
MLLTAAVLTMLAAPAAQTAPDDDPVRVALYGRPEDASIADLVGSPATHLGRSVRLSARFDQGGADDTYRLCQAQECLRLVPEEGLMVVLRARAAQWVGQEVQVTGVLFRQQPQAGQQDDTAFAVRFWRIAMRPSATAAAPASLPGDPITLESLVYAGGARDGQVVKVQGRFRGRNLHGDLPASSQRGSGDWVIKDDYYAVWVTGHTPDGAGWKLDPQSMEDTRSWVEVSGRPETRKGFVYLRATDVSPLAPPAAAEAVAPPPAAATRRTPPPVVVFSLPLETEELSPTEGRLLIQFSKYMDPTSFTGRVRLRYAGEQATFAPARATYDATRRTLLVETGALSPGRELECVLLEGVIDVQGQALVPRQGAIVSGVVDVLRYRVSAGEAGASGTGAGSTGTVAAAGRAPSAAATALLNSSCSRARRATERAAVPRRTRRLISASSAGEVGRLPRTRSM